MGVTVQSKAKKIATIVLASFCCLVLMLFYVTIPLQLCFWGLIWGFSLPNRLEEELDAWEPGMQDQVAIFRLSDSGISGIWKSERRVTVNGKKIDLTEVFGSSYFYDEYHSWRRLEEIFCVYDNTIYGMVSPYN